MPRARLFLIDTYGFIFRAYHARARSAVPPMRTSKGLQTEAVYIFHNMLRKLRTSYTPEYIAAIYESIGPTLRNEQYEEYKANRSEMPDDLREQLPWVRRLLEALRIPILQFAGFEADDVIGTISRQACEAGAADVVIVSSDKDMLQLVRPGVSMLNPMKDDAWYDPAAAEAFMGVAPERVPDLLALKGDAVDNIPGAPGIGDKGAKDLVLRFGTVEAALERAGEVERKTYRESLLNHRDQILLSKQLATIDCGVPIEWDLQTLAAQEPDNATLREIYKDLEFFSFLKELKPADATEAKDYQSLFSAAEVREFTGSIPETATVAVALNIADDGGVGLAWQTGTARGIPWGLLDSVRTVLEDETRPKSVHDIKSFLLECSARGLHPRNLVHDPMLYAFLLLADPASCRCDVLAEKYLDRKLGNTADAQADCALELTEKLSPEIDRRGFRQLYEEIDRPLVDVLTEMERCGIRVEPQELRTLSSKMEGDLRALEARICELAGTTFNINSPQQLAKVLFEDLKLPSPVRYGRGKTVSTAADVLESLAAEHPIASLVLEYRQISKLKGTYIDALPALIRPGTGRIHTTFNQAGAATGRLSSSNPNLQNIPIRTELGREIRAAFVPEPGWVMVVADYSQIELRLLAHVSGDELLVNAFRNGEDIHTRTAAEVFNVAPLMVTSDMRRSAKAVNFGIVYGQTSFGLATSLGIDRKEADLYIRNYFARYIGVKKWIEQTIAEVRQSGVSRTLFGRERPIPDMNARNPNARSFAERTAVNTPLQGTAAELIKLAMIRIHRRLQQDRSQARLLLQVHDELVLETPREELDSIRTLVKTEMEGVMKLQVPLLVDTGAGPNWRDAK
jgi:DNA polymerase-1